MKKHSWNRFLMVLKAIIVFLILLSADAGLFAQPGMPGDHGQNGNQGPGGYAPIGEGLVIFLVSAAIYGIKKMKAKNK